MCEGAGGGGMGGQAEGGLSLPLGHRQWCCVISRCQRCTQSTGEIETDIVSSLELNQF